MTFADVAWFWAQVIKFEARNAWRALPGPWPVKIALVLVCLAIPGPADEAALVAITAAWRAYRAHKAQRH